MNQRIKLLAEQALQLVADEHTKGDTSRLNTHAYHVKDLIDEKFAELIVRECAITVIDGCEMRNAEDVKRAEYHAKRIKQHFGVES